MSRHQSSRGQALVETVLVLLGTLALVIAVLDLGQFMMQIHFFNERARAAARWAATHSVDGPTIQRYACYGDPAAGRSGPGFMGLTPGNVTVTRTGAGTPNDTITVAISKELTLFTPLVSKRFTPRASMASSPVESLVNN